MIFVSFVEPIQERAIRELVDAVSFFLEESIDSEVSEFMAGRCQESIQIACVGVVVLGFKDSLIAIVNQEVNPS